MGQAKARGTFEERKAQAIERRKADDAAAEQERLEAIRLKHEAIRNLPPEERKERVLLAGGSGHSAALLAMLLASSGARVPGMPLIVHEKSGGDGEHS